MFFESARQARIRAQIDNIGLASIGFRHVVTPCKRYIYTNYFEMDYINGFTLTLQKL